MKVKDLQEDKINTNANSKKGLNSKLNEFKDLNKIARPNVKVEEDSIIVIGSDDDDDDDDDDEESLNLKQISSKDNKDKCPICGKSSKDLIKHLYYHERKRKHHDQFKCKYCSRTFMYQSHITRHELSHEKRSNFECPKCKKKCILKKDLRAHLDLHCR